MQTIAHLSSIEEAHLLRTVLAEEDIEAFVLDEGMGGHFLGPSSVLADVRVQVRDEDAARASPFVNQFVGNRTEDRRADPPPSQSPVRNAPAWVLPALSLALLALYFVGSKVEDITRVPLPQDVQDYLQSLSTAPRLQQFFDRFGIVSSISYGIGLLGLAAQWRWARPVFVCTWIWMTVHGAIAGGAISYGAIAVFSTAQCIGGGFVLGLSFCPPWAEKFARRRGK